MQEKWVVPGPMPFTKLFGHRLMTSSLWLEPPDVLKLFLSMLFQADETGLVSITGVKTLAASAEMNLEATERALAILEAPDPASRSRDQDGRRVVRVEHPLPGWMVVNARRYRHAQTKHQAFDAERKRKARRDRRHEEPDTAFDKTNGVGGKNWAGG